MSASTTNDLRTAVLAGLLDLFSQHRRWLLFFGTGSSCALDKRLGMPALAQHLKNNVGDAADWPQIQAKLDDGKSLEMALTDVPLRSKTKSLIQRATGDYVAGIDRHLRDGVLLGKRPWVGERLVKALVERLPPRNPRLPVVTPNYDMLIEYACTRHGIRYTTGFSGDLIRRWDWEQSQESLNRCRASREGTKGLVLSSLPRVELLKVHGSINRFTQRQGNGQVECDLWSEEVPDGFERIVAAPGEQKYEQFASIVETAARASQAERQAMAFAVIGYGFNDRHLHQQILDRVHSEGCPLVAMTLMLDGERIRELRALSKRVWVLVAGADPTGGGKEAQTLVYAPCADEPVVFENESLWSCDYFSTRIMGA